MSVGVLTRLWVLVIIQLRTIVNYTVVILMQNYRFLSATSNTEITNPTNSSVIEVHTESQLTIHTSMRSITYSFHRCLEIQTSPMSLPCTFVPLTLQGNEWRETALPTFGNTHNRIFYIPGATGCAPCVNAPVVRVVHSAPISFTTTMCNGLILKSYLC